MANPDVCFRPMADILPEQDGERFAVVHFEYTQETIDRETERYRALGILEALGEPTAGRYAKLVDKVEQEILMSDTWMLQHSNAAVVEGAHGHVLIGGLGIGLVVVPLWERDAVQRITVVEKHREVIDLVFPHLQRYFARSTRGAGRLEVIHADVFTYEPHPQVLFDTIYIDIWKDIDPRSRREIRILQSKYSKYLRDGQSAWIGSWREDDTG